MPDKPDTAAPVAKAGGEVEDLELSRYRSPGRLWVSVAFLLTVVSVSLAVNQIFRLNFFKNVTGHVLVDQQYMYLILGSMLAMLFIFMPAYKSAPRRRVPVYDVAAFFITLVLTAYFTWHGEAINEEILSLIHI